MTLERQFNGIRRDGSDEQNKAARPKEGQPLSFEDVLSPEHLTMITEASGGFRFVPDPALAEEALQSGVLKTGYTNKQTKTIHYNPLLLAGSEALHLPPWRRVDIQGFSYHEAGHHAPDVLAFDDRLIEDLKNPEIIPKSYRGDPHTEAQFFRSLYSHLDNGLVDMWLESYMGRRPYFPVRDSVTEFQTAKGEMESFTHLSKPEQLVQALLRSRYHAQKNLHERLDADVFAAIGRIQESGAMGMLIDRSHFENYFSTPLDKERSIERKVDAYRSVFLPEYLKLLEAELEERKQARQEQHQKKHGDGAEGKRGGGSGKKEQEGEQTRGKSGKGERQPSSSGAVPLTKEEERELIEEILQELEKAGKEFQALAPSPESQEQKRAVFNTIEQTLKERHKRLQEGKAPLEKPSLGEEAHGLEALRRRAEELQRDAKAQQQRGLAEAMQVRQESIQHWERIKEKYKAEIESLAGALAEIFLEDRRKRMEFLKREGEIVPGLEYETIAATIAGEIDPDTKMRDTKNPEFLETEMEFIVDASESMGGEKIAQSIDLMVIIVEAFKRIRETLAEEDLLDPHAEQPFRVGVTKFTTVPERVTKITEPLDDRKELLIVDRVSMVGGGTKETETLRGVYKELTLETKKVIKIIVVLSDGEGDKGSVAPVIRQVEEDDEVIFLAVGFGDTQESAEGIVQTYIAPLRKGPESNVFGYPTDNPKTALPAVLEFLKREVGKRRQLLG